MRKTDAERKQASRDKRKMLEKTGASRCVPVPVSPDLIERLAHRTGYTQEAVEAMSDHELGLLIHDAD